MAVEIDVVYEGQLHCACAHGPSGARLATDAPKDNQGKGESFSPTDLVAAALGACMLTIIGIVSQRNGYPIEGTTVKVKKEMVADPIRRIGKLTLTFRVKNGSKLTEADRKKLEHAAHTCPVHKSLHPDIETPTKFIWE
ncbi:MAG: OsmC family protein [Planctomycetota bacterium]|nr:OsmC family protein [Planctomycetota bacterium]